MPFPNQPQFIPDEKPAEHSPAPASEIQLTWGVKIPLRDGVQLNATLYRPPGEARLPAVFTLTPYISDSYHARAAYFSRRGYAFALVDCRGRGNSQGSFSPMIQEVNDAADVVSWLAEQPWCDGQVSMWGGSYGGFDQWMALKAAPAALKTIVPAAAAHAGVDFPHFRRLLLSLRNPVADPGERRYRQRCPVRRPAVLDRKVQPPVQGAAPTAGA